MWEVSIWGLVVKEEKAFEDKEPRKQGNVLVWIRIIAHIKGNEIRNRNIRILRVLTELKKIEEKDSHLSSKVVN